jgi:flagellar basal body-associated protein FliL
MSKKNKTNSKTQQKQHQKQKMSHRMVLIIGTCCFMLLAGGTFVFFNFSDVKNSFGRDQQERKVINIKDQVFTSEFALPAAVLSGQESGNAKSIMIKPIKPLTR